MLATDSGAIEQPRCQGITAGPPAKTLELFGIRQPHWLCGCWRVRGRPVRPLPQRARTTISRRSMQLAPYYTVDAPASRNPRTVPSKPCAPAVPGRRSTLPAAEVLPDENSPTCPGFIAHAAAALRAQGAPAKRVMTDNTFACLLSCDFQGRAGRFGRKTPPDPTSPPLAERQSRTLKPPPYRRLGLPATLSLKPSTLRRPAAMARLLQQPPATRHPRRQTAHQQVQPAYWLITPRRGSIQSTGVASVPCSVPVPARGLRAGSTVPSVP